MSLPNSQDPNSPLYQFINTQPQDTPSASPNSSLSHFTVRQFVPTAITKTWPVIVTIVAHGFRNGQSVRTSKFITKPIANATGMAQLNNRQFYVQQATTDTFALYDASGLPIDGRDYTTFIAGGQFVLGGPQVLCVNPSLFPPLGIPPFPPV